MNDNTATNILAIITAIADCRDKSQHDSLEHQLAILLDSFCGESCHMTFTQSDSNYVNRTWHQLLTSAPFMTSPFRHSADVKIGISVSNQPLIVGDEPVFAIEDEKLAHGLMAKEATGAHYAHLVAFSALDVGTLQNYVNAVIATSNPDAACELVKAGGVLIYDDTGIVQQTTRTEPIFPVNVIEIEAKSFPLTASSSRSCLLALWKGSLNEDRAASWLSQERRAAQREAIGHIVAQMPPDLSNHFPLNTTFGISREADVLRLIKILSFDKIQPFVLEEEQLFPPIFLKPEHTKTLVDITEKEKRQINDFATTSGAIIAIWDKLMKDAQIGWRISSDSDQWKRLSVIGDALGIDTAVDALLDGTPLEHVIAH